MLSFLRKYPITWEYPFEMLPCAYYIAPLGRRWATCCIIRVDMPEPAKPFKSLEEEWVWIEQNEMGLDEPFPEAPCYLRIPTYVSCKSKESIRIHKRFVRAREKLAKLFCSMKPSEVIAQAAMTPIEK